MKKEPNEMLIEELDAEYGEAQKAPAITHVVALVTNDNHDRFTFEVVTEDRRRLELPFTQTALQSMLRLLDGNNLQRERPKAN